MAPDGERQQRRSLADLVKSLGDDAATLVRQEIALVRAEIRENLGALGRDAARIAVGAGIVLFGVLVFVAFLVIGLGALLGGMYWLSSLLIALLFLGGGGALVYSGARGLGATRLVPEKALASLGTTKEWVGARAVRLRHALGGGATALPEPPLRAALTSPRGSAVAEREAAGPALVKGAKNRAPASRRRLDPSRTGLVRRVLDGIARDDIPGQAAKVAFYMFLSLPPSLLVLFGLTGFFGGDETAALITDQLQAQLPGSAADPESAAGFLNEFVEQVVNESAPGPFSFGLVLAIWAASAVFVALTEALNVAYDIEEDRSWFRRRGVAIGVMIGFVTLFLVGSVTLLAGPQIAAALELGGTAEVAWSILQWPLAFLVIVLAFFLVYFVLPNRNQWEAKWIIFGTAAIAAALWVVATLGFRIYIANFGSYSETYGLVGAIIVLLLWMYLTALVLLAGGELNAELERKA
jgi:membrane protein